MGEKKRVHTMTEWNLESHRDFLIVNLELCIILEIIQTQIMLLYFILYYVCILLQCVCVYTCLTSLWSTDPSTMSNQCGSGQAPIIPGLGESTCFKFVQLRQGIISITVTGLVKVSDKANQLKPSWISKEKRFPSKIIFIEDNVDAHIGPELQQTKYTKKESRRDNINESLEFLTTSFNYI